MRAIRNQALGLIMVLIVAAFMVGYLITRQSPGNLETAASGEVPRVSLLAAGKEDLARPLASALVLMRPLDAARIPVATRFDAPLGSEHAALTYNAQPFGVNRHLGDDLNGIGGWDSDLGDAVHAVGEGRVMFAGWASEGWGNMVILAHRVGDDSDRVLQSVYGHLDRVRTRVGENLHRGDVLGTVGKGAGQYLAHLHFEVRESIALDPGAGYHDRSLMRLSPESFLATLRGAPPDLLSPAPRLEPDPAATEPWTALQLQFDVEEPAEAPLREENKDPEPRPEGAGSEAARKLRQ